MKSIVQMLSDAGIYVLLDFHQDALSEKFCGEGILYICQVLSEAFYQFIFYFIGVPLWAAQPDNGHKNWFSFPFPQKLKPFPVNNDGVPSNVSCAAISAAGAQLTYAGASAYDRLYNNYDGLRDSFVEYWKVVARTFLPFKNILGYDLMNEPFAGNVFLNPLLLLPGYADAHRLESFYGFLSEGIR